MSGREFMDCKECHTLGEHTRKAGCIIATERAAAVNEHSKVYSQVDLDSMAQQAMTNMINDPVNGVMSTVMKWAKLGRVVAKMNDEFGQLGVHGIGAKGIPQKDVDKVIETFLKLVYRVAEEER